MKLETKLNELLSHYGEAEIEVLAHELWRDCDGGFSSNDRWRIARGTLQEVLPAMRERWETFKLNYAPKARVKDITDVGFDKYSEIEVDCLPVFSIRPA